MKQPCELIVWYIIPTTRAVLAKELFKLGMKQKEISELLDITQPAVSQYLSDKRGGREIELTEEMGKMIKELAFNLKEGLASKKDIVSEICETCRKGRTEDILCNLHRLKEGVSDDCHQCLDLANDTICESYCPHSFDYSI
ncbi:MAG: transcriptional regulator [Methanobrevibacter sp.]|jgi:predicted transcriptional regulator|nr:transcriptional regulator [Methanobrevibacter sp.]